MKIYPLYFGSGSYILLSPFRYNIYCKIKEALNEIINKKGKCNYEDLNNHLSNSVNTIRYYIILLCSATERLGQPPQFIIKEKYYKRPKYIKKGLKFLKISYIYKRGGSGIYIT